MTEVQVIGRQAERHHIADWLDGQRPGALLVEGTAGIGKSTLWRYGLDRATPWET